MSQTDILPDLSTARERFLELIAGIRPELHRYCSRLVGSAIDGEDLVQEALAKAFYAISLSTEVPPLRPWLFRIAHNTAIDFLRRYERRHVEPVPELPEDAMIDDAPDPDIVRAALSSFIALPVLQRSAVILKDVLGYSVEETAEVIGTTVPAVKAALVRGRATLRAAPRREPVPWRNRPEVEAKERALLSRYVSLFNARDWDGLRSLLGEEVRLDLVSKAARQGKSVGGYFGRYAAERDVRLVLGKAEGREAIGVFGADQQLRYVILLEWRGDRVSLIRDYRYVPYLAGEIDFVPLAE